MTYNEIFQIPIFFNNTLYCVDSFTLFSIIMCHRNIPFHSDDKMKRRGYKTYFIWISKSAINLSMQKSTKYGQ